MRTDLAGRAWPARLLRDARWIDILGVTATALLIAEVVLHALDFMFFFCWSEFRLGWVYSLRWGHTLYPTPDRGPLTGLLYGPVSVLAYLPVLVCPGPVSAMTAGAVWTVCLGFGPVVWMHRVGAVRGGRAHWLGTLAFGFFAMRDLALGYSLFSPAHDVTALGLGLCSVLMLTLRPGRPGTREIAAAAVLAALATWSKPNAAFFLPGLVVYLAGMWGSGAVARFLAWALAAETVLFGLMAGAFGMRGLLFQMFAVASHHPFQISFREAARQVADFCLVPGLVVSVALACRHRFAEGPMREEASPGGRIALACLLIAVSSAPIAALGLAKLGGFLNSLSFCLYFLAAATSFTLAEGCYLLPKRARRPYWLVAAMLVAADARDTKPAAHLRQVAFDETPAARAYRFARRHPGAVYFPWNPVVASYAERRYWTTEDGIVEPELGGLKIPDATLAATLPRSPEFVAFPPYYYVLPQGSYHILRRFYTDYTQAVSVPELPGWRVFTRPSPARAKAGDR